MTPSNKKRSNAARTAGIASGKVRAEKARARIAKNTRHAALLASRDALLGHCQETRETLNTLIHAGDARWKLHLESSLANGWTERDAMNSWFSPFGRRHKSEPSPRQPSTTKGTCPKCRAEGHAHVPRAPNTSYCRHHADAYAKDRRKKLRSGEAVPRLISDIFHRLDAHLATLAYRVDSLTRQVERLSAFREDICHGYDPVRYGRKPSDDAAALALALDSRFNALSERINRIINPSR